MSAGKIRAKFTGIAAMIAIVVVACQMQTSERVPLEDAVIDGTNIHLSAKALSRIETFNSEADLNQFKVRITRRGNTDLALNVFRNPENFAGKRVLVGTLVAGQTEFEDTDVKPEHEYVYRVEVPQGAGTLLSVKVPLDATLRGKLEVTRENQATDVRRFHRLLIDSSSQILTHANGFKLEADEILVRDGAVIARGERNEVKLADGYPKQNERIFIRARTARGRWRIDAESQAVDIRLREASTLTLVPKFSSDPTPFLFQVAGENYLWCDGIPVPASKNAGVYVIESTSPLDHRLLYVTPGFGRIYLLTVFPVDNVKEDSSPGFLHNVACRADKNQLVILDLNEAAYYPHLPRRHNARGVGNQDLHEAAQRVIRANKTLSAYGLVAEVNQAWKRDSNAVFESQLIEKFPEEIMEIARASKMDLIAFGLPDQTNHVLPELGHALWPQQSLRDKFSYDPTMASYLKELRALYWNR